MSNEIIEFEQAERHKKILKNYRGYKRFSFEDETSQFDTKGVWVGGSEYYSRTYTLMVPVRLKPENFDAWLEKHYDDAIWID